MPIDPRIALGIKNTIPETMNAFSQMTARRAENDLNRAKAEEQLLANKNAEALNAFLKTNPSDPSGLAQFGKAGVDIAGKLAEIKQKGIEDRIKEQDVFSKLYANRLKVLENINPNAPDAGEQVANWHIQNHQYPEIHNQFGESSYLKGLVDIEKASQEGKIPEYQQLAVLGLEKYIKQNTPTLMSTQYGVVAVDPSKRSGTVIEGTQPLPKPVLPQLKIRNMGDKTVVDQFVFDPATNTYVMLPDGGTERPFNRVEKPVKDVALDRYSVKMSDKIAESDASLFSGAMNGPRTRDTANTILTLADSKNAILGYKAGVRLEAARILGFAGNESAEKDVAATETFIKAQIQAVLDAIPRANLGTGRGFTEQDFRNLQKAVSGDIDYSRAGLKKLANDLLRAQTFIENQWNERKSALEQANPGKSPLKSLGMDKPINPNAVYPNAATSASQPAALPKGTVVPAIQPPMVGIPPVKVPPKQAAPQSAPKGSYEDAVQRLKSDPRLAPYFDQYYGAGASKRVLGGR
jgi:hypothetical protein